ncbi:hypothetical protein [Bacillus kwashiorkori]|uniref:hypothetical protein n=1 Tax=Bacillus kwashiorkori TaxID=1522318 RepID=UPI00078083B7|nr:hypothetical protein [Bacillus kwashiorkori]
MKFTKSKIIIRLIASAFIFGQKWVVSSNMLHAKAAQSLTENLPKEKKSKKKIWKELQMWRERKL